ncbi:MAG TPA: cysteine desulfurase family protein [Gemmatales bacterium]|nr:cysteine desulfurase family protein [Gemmatales bacterium]HMP58359.1 cysteine desulfurase family protein [Gemmatales bacterium]
MTRPEPIDLDANATTAVLPEVVSAMAPFWQARSGNPASAHRLGQLARQALEEARERIAHLIDAAPASVVFTSGATEANNTALRGLLPDRPEPGRRHILTTPLEHPSVSEVLAQLARLGFEVESVPATTKGTVSPTAFRERLRPETCLAVAMLANHETGALLPVAELARGLVSDPPARPVPVHCDAAQAVGKVPVSFRQLDVATLSASAHKFHGPQGVGFLVVRPEVNLRPWLWGGHQQQGRRPGTEPVALAVGCAVALELAVRDRDRRLAHLGRLRAIFLEAVRQARPAPIVNGPAEADAGLVHTLNLSFPGLPAALLLMRLDLAGVACSAGSACSSGSLLPSPVLAAMGLEPARLESAVRFSFPCTLTEEKARQAGAIVVREVAALQAAQAEP